MAMTKETFDRQELLEELEDDLDFLKESVEILKTDAPTLLLQIEEAISGENTDGIRIAAHTIKGMVSNFYAKPSMEAAAEMEALAGDGVLQNIDKVQIALREEIEQLIASLDSLIADQESH